MEERVMYIIDDWDGNPIVAGKDVTWEKYDKAAAEIRRLQAEIRVTDAMILDAKRWLNSGLYNSVEDALDKALSRRALEEANA